MKLVELKFGQELSVNLGWFETSDQILESYYQNQYWPMVYGVGNWQCWKFHIAILTDISNTATAFIVYISWGTSEIQYVLVDIWNFALDGLSALMQHCITLAIGELKSPMEQNLGEQNLSIANPTLVLTFHYIQKEEQKNPCLLQCDIFKLLWCKFGWAMDTVTGNKILLGLDNNTS